MPIYVYRCQRCGDVLERRQSFKDPALTTCETCSGELRRVLQPVGVIFKGSGFYSTDYRHNGAASSDDGKPASSKTEEHRDHSPTASTDQSSSSESKPSSTPAAVTTSSTSSE